MARNEKTNSDEIKRAYKGRRNARVNHDQVYQLCVVNELTQAQVATKLGVSRPYISKLCKRFGIKVSRGRRSRVQFPRDLLYQLYAIDGLAANAIRLKLGVPISKVFSELKRHGIDRRRPPGRVPRDKSTAQST